MRRANSPSARWPERRELRRELRRGLPASGCCLTRLTHIQDAFQRFLLRGDSAIESAVIGTERVPVGTRLGIYGDGYRARLIEALQVSFPVLASLLGETDFQTLAGKYVDAHESSFFSIRYYGHTLADFLTRDADYAAAPLLAELARWEWVMAAVFDAADAGPIGTGAFAGLDPEDWAQLRFEWSPSVHVLELEWNVPQLWKAVTEQTEPPEPSLNSAPTGWLLWRRELQIYFRVLSTEEVLCIAAARAGQSFGELCEMLCTHLEEYEASARAAGFLRSWVESGLIVKAHLPP